MTFQADCDQVLSSLGWEQYASFCVNNNKLPKQAIDTGAIKRAFESLQRFLNSNNFQQTGLQATPAVTQAIQTAIEKSDNAEARSKALLSKGFSTFSSAFLHATLETQTDTCFTLFIQAFCNLVLLLKKIEEEKKCSNGDAVFFGKNLCCLITQLFPENLSEGSLKNHFQTLLGTSNDDALLYQRIRAIAQFVASLKTHSLSTILQPHTTLRTSTTELYEHLFLAELGPIIESLIQTWSPRMDALEASNQTSPTSTVSDAQANSVAPVAPVMTVTPASPSLTQHLSVPPPQEWLVPLQEAKTELDNAKVILETFSKTLQGSTTAADILSFDHTQTRFSELNALIKAIQTVSSKDKRYFEPIHAILSPTFEKERKKKADALQKQLQELFSKLTDLNTTLQEDQQTTQKKHEAERSRQISDLSTQVAACQKSIETKTKEIDQIIQGLMLAQRRMAQIEPSASAAPRALGDNSRPRSPSNESARSSVEIQTEALAPTQPPSASALSAEVLLSVQQTLNRYQNAHTQLMRALKRIAYYLLSLSDGLRSPERQYAQEYENAKNKATKLASSLNKIGLWSNREEAAPQTEEALRTHFGLLDRQVDKKSSKLDRLLELTITPKAN